MKKLGRALGLDIEKDLMIIKKFLTFQKSMVIIVNQGFGKTNLLQHTNHHSLHPCSELWRPGHQKSGG